jgi:hypothetical protein
MGNHLSSDVWVKLRERAHTLTMLDLLKAAKSDAAIDKLPTISEDSTVQRLVAALANSTSGAMLVTDAAGNVVSSIDLFCVIRYVLTLYEGATVVREHEFVHESYDFWCVAQKSQVCWVCADCATTQAGLRQLDRAARGGGTGQGRFARNSPRHRVVLHRVHQG